MTLMLFSSAHDSEEPEVVGSTKQVLLPTQIEVKPVGQGWCCWQGGTGDDCDTNNLKLGAAGQGGGTHSAVIDTKGKQARRRL